MGSPNAKAVTLLLSGREHEEEGQLSNKGVVECNAAFSIPADGGDNTRSGAAAGWPAGLRPVATRAPSAGIAVRSWTPASDCDPFASPALHRKSGITVSLSSPFFYSLSLPAAAVLTVLLNRFMRPGAFIVDLVWLPRCRAATAGRPTGLWLACGWLVAGLWLACLAAANEPAWPV